jgi:hypothetical protein
MSVLKNISSKKKPYHRPTYDLMSVGEVGALLGKGTPGQENTLRAGRTPSRNEAPVLLVEGYEGELEFIGQTTGTAAGRVEPLSILKGGGLVEMQIAGDRDSASPETFLLLDLRQRGHEERGLLDSIGGIPDPRGTVPLVMLVTSIEQFENWRGINATYCWQLRGGPSPAELGPALRSFLQLCAVITNRSTANKRALIRTSKYVLRL